MVFSSWWTKCKSNHGKDWFYFVTIVLACAKRYNWFKSHFLHTLRNSWSKHFKNVEIGSAIKIRAELRKSSKSGWKFWVWLGYGIWDFRGLVNSKRGMQQLTPLPPSLLFVESKKRHDASQKRHNIWRCPCMKQYTLICLQEVPAQRDKCFLYALTASSSRLCSQKTWPIKNVRLSTSEIKYRTLGTCQKDF